MKATFPQNMVFDEQLTRVSRLRYLSWTTKHVNDDQANELALVFVLEKEGKFDIRPVNSGSNINPNKIRKLSVFKIRP